MAEAAPVSRWAQRKQQREDMYSTSTDAIQVLRIYESWLLPRVRGVFLSSGAPEFPTAVP